MNPPAAPAPDFLHDAIMEAVVFAAERFLGGGDWQTNLDLVLARLGEAAGVSRAYLFKRSDLDGRPVVTRRGEWVATAVTPQIDNPALRDLSLRDAGLDIWEDGLADGEIMQAHVNSVPEQAQRLMSPQAIQSLIHVPIHVDGDWWGFIGFDECRGQRVWTASEQSALRAAGQLLGSAIARHRLERDYDTQRRQARLQADIGAVVTEGGLGTGVFPERCVRLLVDRLGLDFAGLWRRGDDGSAELLASHAVDGATPTTSDRDVEAVLRGESADPLDGTAEGGDTRLPPNRVAMRLEVGEEPLGVAVIEDSRPIPAATRDALWSVCDEIALALKQGSSIERVRAQEARFRALIATAPDGILVLDEAACIVSANAALEALVGLDERALLGRDISSFLPEDARADFCAGVAAYMELGMSDPDWTGREWSWSTADGRELPVEVLFGGYQDGDRHFFTAFVRDVTERRRAEENARTLIREQAARSEAEAAHRRSEFLSEASRALATSFDYATTLASVVQLAVPELADYGWVDVLEEGGTLRRVGVAHVDPELEPVVLHALRQLDEYEAGGHPLARLFEEGCALVLPDLDLESALEAAPDDAYREAHRALAPRSVLAVPVVVRDRTVAAIVLSFSGSGRLYSREDLALARDLAARAALAVENADLYDQALVAKRARDDILGVVAHDLRNPLNTIGMAAQSLGDVDHSGVRRLGAAIERSVSLMNRLIGDLLQTRELDAGALRLERRRQSAWAIAEEAITTMQPLAAARGLELAATRGEGLCDVEVDRVRILQVISNLVGNAVKFTPEGGRIELTCEADGDFVRFAVRDNGPGIPSEQIPHVFGRFWKARATDREGLGLGLSIAEGFVTAHGGRIWVESEAGSGATFYFTLPVAARTEASPAARVSLEVP